MIRLLSVCIVGWLLLSGCSDPVGEPDAALPSDSDLSAVMASSDLRALGDIGATPTDAGETVDADGQPADLMSTGCFDLACGPFAFVPGDRHLVPISAATSKSLAAADLDGDGRTDLLVDSARATTQLSILRNLGGGKFAAPEITSFKERFYGWAVADFDGDGWIDVALGRPQSVVMLRNQGGKLQPPSEFPIGTPVPVSLGSAADLNEDGKPDLVGAGGNKGVFILPNLGAGKFGAPVWFDTQVQEELESLEVRDYDGDGHLDFGAVGGFFNSWKKEFRIVYLDGALRQIDGGGFDPGEPVQFTVLDMDGDGDLDLFFTMRNLHRAVIGRNLGGRNKYAYEELPVTKGFYGDEVAAGDLNRDGRTDLVIEGGLDDGGAGIYQLRLLRNEGGGMLPVRQVLPHPTLALLLHDFDGDGRLDIATVQHHDKDWQAISFLFNRTP